MIFLIYCLISHGSNTGFSCDIIIRLILQVIVLATAMLVSYPHSLVLKNTAECPRTFHLVYIIIPNFNWVTRMLALSWVKFEILLWSQSKIIVCFVVFLHTALHKKETKKRGKNHAHMCAYRIVQTLYLAWTQQPVLVNLLAWTYLTWFSWTQTQLTCSFLQTPFGNLRDVEWVHGLFLFPFVLGKM